MEIQGFIGPSNTLRAGIVDCERTINKFVEFTQPGVPRSPAWLAPIPGLKPFVVSDTALGSSASGGVRGQIYQDGRHFAVIGVRFYEVFATHTINAQGVVVDDGKPVTFVSGGTANNQLAMASGGHLYVFDLSANSFAEVTSVDLVATPVAMIGFCDGYLIVLKRASRLYQISALFDFTTYDALDIAEISEATDDVRAMTVFHREITLLGSKTKESWADIGDPLFPFAPVPGSLQQQGIIGPWPFALVADTICWLGANELGGGIAYRAAQDYQAQRISTHAVEYAWSQLPRIDNAEAYSYEQDGHQFFCLYFPSGVTHWVYDFATNLWHERALWDTVKMRYTPDVPRNHAYAFNQKHLFGSRLGPVIYEADFRRSDYELIASVA